TQSLELLVCRTRRGFGGCVSGLENPVSRERRPSGAETRFECSVTVRKALRSRVGDRLSVVVNIVVEPNCWFKQRQPLSPTKHDVRRRARDRWVRTNTFRLEGDVR